MAEYDDHYFPDESPDRENDEPRPHFRGSGLKNVLLVGGIAVVFGGLYYTHNYQEKMRNLKSEVTKRADENNDGIVSDAEWRKVYEIIDKSKQIEGRRELTIDEMEKYLQSIEKTKAESNQH